MTLDASIRPSTTGPDTNLSPTATLRVQILGPLRLWHNGVEFSAGARQQAQLLALLLARQGDPVSKTDLIQLIWGDRAPDSALNVIHKYVGALRRLLEPSLLPGATSSYLVRRGGSYVCTAGSDTLDLAAFRHGVTAARKYASQERPEDALKSYAQALQLWRGPCGDGLALPPTALPIFAGVNAEFFDASTEAAELAVTLGRPELVLAPLQRAALMAPLHEPVQAALISALGAAGRQADALSVFSTVRSRLVEELGIDPGAVLESAMQKVLRQELTPTVETRSTAAFRQTSEPLAEGTRPASSLPGVVGRSEELGVLRGGLRRASSGETALIVVEGEAGAGKTYLMEQIAREAADADFLVAWGRCIDGAGAPSMWPWVQVVRAVLDELPAAERGAEMAGVLGHLLQPHDDFRAPAPSPEASGQFHLFEGVSAC